MSTLTPMLPDYRVIITDTWRWRESNPRLAVLLIYNQRIVRRDGFEPPTFTSSEYCSSH